MKKILLICAVFAIIFLTACEKKEEKINTNNGQEVVTNNEEYVPEHDIGDEYYENKKYIYLIDNELFFTVENKNIVNAKDSNVNLCDLFENEAYYDFEDIFSSNKKKKSTELEVAVYHDVFDGSLAQQEPYDYVISKLSPDSIARKEEGLDCYSLGYNEKDVTIYSLPAGIAKDENDDAKQYLGVYSATINFERGFVTNDGSLYFLNPKATTSLSDNAKNAFDKYLTDNGLTVGQYFVKAYRIDLDGDNREEIVYLIENPIDLTDSGYFNGNDQFADDNKLSMVMIEDNDSVVIAYDSYLAKTSTENEFWDSYKGGFRDDIKITFVDLDRDGSLEIVESSEELALEPFDVIRLLDYSEGKVNVLTEFYGPNE